MMVDNWSGFQLFIRLLLDILHTYTTVYIATHDHYHPPTRMQYNVKFIKSLDAVKPYHMTWRLCSVFYQPTADLIYHTFTQYNYHFLLAVVLCAYRCVSLRYINGDGDDDDDNVR